ncbi:FliI/YscN family ATPase [Yoonia sp. 2307UL14-13]|uniref:FliI/YscN family ATPase n=1 Tax=Yoonia sp. 2307UL14-13 TaxID=3126506 RepID=UPI0030955E9E
MNDKFIDRMIRAVTQGDDIRPVGRVIDATAQTVQVAIAGDKSRIGDRAKIHSVKGPISGEIVRLGETGAQVMIDGAGEGAAIGDRVVLDGSAAFAPDASWVGRVIDPDGKPLDGRPLLPGIASHQRQRPPPPPNDRRAMGERLETGFAVFNTVLPIVRGQRIGLFAGSGVGKSTLIADLARNVTADVVVIGLVGERGRELRHFVQEVLGPKGLKRAVVVAATSDSSPRERRNCAWSAVAVAEYFRDQGLHVLLLLDSVTRFCEAHREIAVAAGEAASLRGFPATTGPAIAALCERAGPGVEHVGDITAVFSVLVAGSDMDEPVADMLRGVLDGHIVLDREIAERGRFPAVDVLRSVSRSLPEAANTQENALITQARTHLGTYDRAEMMIQAGLYTQGSDPAIDAAIACKNALDSFLALQDQRGTLAHFAKLRQAVSPTSTEMQRDENAN